MAVARERSCHSPPFPGRYVRVLQISSSLAENITEFLLFDQQPQKCETIFASMISFIYFDLGGVVIRDFSGTNKRKGMNKFLKISKEIEKDVDNLYFKYEDKDLYLDRDVDTLIPIFEKKFGMKFPKGFSFLHYLVDHFEKNASIWPIIKMVQEKYRTGLLTNMYPRMFEAIQKRKIMPPADWEIVIDSTFVNLQKPDPAIYKFAEGKAGVLGKEILFIENTLKKVEGAQKAGWQTFHYVSADPEGSSKNLLEFLNDKLNLT